MIKVCDRRITDGRRVLEQAEAVGDGPELHLPPRVFSEVPSDSAVGEIVTAFERGFNTEGYGEDTEDLQAYREEVGARVADRIARSMVDRIRFLPPDRARVQFSLTLTSGATFPIDGVAVRIDGSWKVSRDTQVDLLRRGSARISEGGK